MSDRIDWNMQLALSFFVIVSIIFCFDRTLVSGSAFVASLVSVFIALKYKLDQANYHKDLFEERYKIFLKLDDILWCCFHDKDKKGNKINWRDLVDKLDSIYRKSFFLFGNETYDFISRFRQAVIDFSYYRDNKDTTYNQKIKEKEDNARSFLLKLIDGQNFSKNFPELKVDVF